MPTIATDSSTLPPGEVSEAPGEVSEAPDGVSEAPDGVNEDQAAVDAYAEKVTAAMLGWNDITAMYLGSQLGWYAELARSGPLTADELARATGTNARFAREWLEQQTVGGTLQLADAGAEPADRRFRLVPGAATVLVDESSMSFLEPFGRFAAGISAQLPSLLDAYRDGGGVSWEQYGGPVRNAQAEMNRPWLAGVPSLLADLPHVDAALSRPGAHAADIGAGGGWSAIALAQHYPQLTVTGVDVDSASITLARANAEAAGVSDRVRFVEADAAGLAELGPFDAVFAFECVHDMPDPVAVLAGARNATGQSAPVIVMDEATADEFQPDAGELEQVLYGFSLFVCLPDGMAHENSVATGTVMRADTLRSYARDAGFDDVRIVIPEFGMWRFYELV